MNYIKKMFLAMAITVVMAGCAKADENLPSGIYVTEIQLDGQRDVLFIDWRDNRIACLESGTNNILLDGQLSIQGNRVTCIFDGQGAEMVFCVLKEGALRYQGNKLGENYNPQIVRDLIPNSIFRYSWMETAKYSWKVMDNTCSRDFSEGEGMGR